MFKNITGRHLLYIAMIVGVIVLAMTGTAGWGWLLFSFLSIYRPD